MTLLWCGGGGRAFGFEGWCRIFDLVMCRRGVCAGCSVWFEGVSVCWRATGAVVKVRWMRRDGAAVLVAKVRANEQLGQAIVM